MVPPDVCAGRSVVAAAADYAPQVAAHETAASDRRDMNRRWRWCRLNDRRRRCRMHDDRRRWRVHDRRRGWSMYDHRWRWRCMHHHGRCCLHHRRRRHRMPQRHMNVTRRCRLLERRHRRHVRDGPRRVDATSIDQRRHVHDGARGHTGGHGSRLMVDRRRPDLPRRRRRRRAGVARNGCAPAAAGTAGAPGCATAAAPDAVTAPEQTGRDAGRAVDHRPGATDVARRGGGRFSCRATAGVTPPVVGRRPQRLLCR